MMQPARGRIGAVSFLYSCTQRIDAALISAGNSNLTSEDLWTRYNQLSPRLQSVFLDSACLLNGLEMAALQSLCGPDSDDDIANLEAQGLLLFKQPCRDEPWCLLVPQDAASMALSLADQMRSRRMSAADDALAVLETSKVRHHDFCPVGFLASPCSVASQGR